MSKRRDYTADPGVLYRAGAVNELRRQLKGARTEAKRSKLTARIRAHRAAMAGETMNDLTDSQES